MFLIQNESFLNWIWFFYAKWFSVWLCKFEDHRNKINIDISCAIHFFQGSTKSCQRKNTARTARLQFDRYLIPFAYNVSGRTIKKHTLVFIYYFHTTVFHPSSAVGCIWYHTVLQIRTLKVIHERQSVFL